MDDEPNGSRPILTSLLACCARAASSPVRSVRNVVAAPPSAAINLRRFMISSRVEPCSMLRIMGRQLEDWNWAEPKTMNKARVLPPPAVDGTRTST